MSNLTASKHRFVIPKSIRTFIYICSFLFKVYGGYANVVRRTHIVCHSTTPNVSECHTYEESLGILIIKIHN